MLDNLSKLSTYQQKLLNEKPLKKVQLPFLNLNGQPKVILSNLLWEKMQFLCNHISTVEWSGCIFYEIHGALDKPEELQIFVHDMIPLDKGTTGFTEYNFDGRVIAYMTEMEYFEYRIGHLHSHHSMKTFFSGTDLEEVNENSEHIKPYLSIIINNAYDFSCKLAFRLKVLNPTIYEYQEIDNVPKQLVIQQSDEYVANYDCLVITPKKEFSVNPSFLAQFNEIMKPKPSKFPTHIANTKPIGFKNDQLEFVFDDFFNSLDSPTVNKKGIDEVSDSGITLVEFEKFYCYLLRLGLDVPGDTMEKVLEDLDESARAEDFNLEQFAYNLKKDFPKNFKKFWNVKILTKREEASEWEEFTDELMFASDEFPILDSLLELLMSPNHE
jgi:hypothetical protein